MKNHAIGHGNAPSNGIGLFPAGLRVGILKGKSSFFPESRIMIRRCSSFAVLAFLAVGGFVPAQDAPITTPYFPLAVGSKWFYKCGENRFRLEVVKFEDVGTTKCARVELFVNNKSEAAEHIAVTKDAVMRFSFDGKKAEPPISFLKLPVKDKETWKVESKVDGHPLKGSFTSGTEADVKVPAGTYPKTITVTGTDLEANGVKLTLKYYFAENVGMVKQVIDIAGQKIVIELEKYEPAKK